MGCGSSSDVQVANQPGERPAAPAAAATATATPATASPAKPGDTRVKKFDDLEKQLRSAYDKPAEMDKLWASLDRNNNGKVSLAEIDAFVSTNYPILDHKPALIRCYKRTCSKAGGGDGDEWVERHEFKNFLINLFFFNRVFEVFKSMDTDSDKKVTLAEFKTALPKLDMKIKDKDAQTEFEKIDQNKGGVITFDELCTYVINYKFPPKKGDSPTKAPAAAAAAPASGPKGTTAAAAPKAEAPKETPKAETKAEAKAEAPKAEAKAEAKPAVESTQELDALEKKIKGIVADDAKLAEEYACLDVNGNSKSTLAEIDKWVVERYPLLNSKPALMRAYKRTISKAGGGDGDDWVEKKEFKALLVNLFYFNRLWKTFDKVDADDDRRISLDEFKAGTKAAGMSLSDADAENEFKSIDKNGGGIILFDEFCMWYADKNVPGYNARSAKACAATPSVDDAKPAAAAAAAPADHPAEGKKPAKDDTPEVRVKDFDGLEKEFLAIAADAGKLDATYKTLDVNGNGKSTLAEIDKWVEEKYPLLNHKPALMRAYKRTISKAGGGDGDDWVEEKEFKKLLINLLYFNKLWKTFDNVDKDDDRRIDFKEFQAGITSLGMSLNDAEAEAEFKSIDANGGGIVLFDEFCSWYAGKQTAK